MAECNFKIISDPSFYIDGDCHTVKVPYMRILNGGSQYPHIFTTYEVWEFYVVDNDWKYRKYTEE